MNNVVPERPKKRKYGRQLQANFMPSANVEDNDRHNNWKIMICYLLSKKDVDTAAMVSRINCELINKFWQTVSRYINVWPWHGRTTRKCKIWFHPHGSWNVLNCTKFRIILLDLLRNQCII